MSRGNFGVQLSAELVKKLVPLISSAELRADFLLCAKLGDINMLYKKLDIIILA